MYENDSVSMLEVLIAAESMNEFLNRVDFIQNVSEYDRNKLEEFRTLREYSGSGETSGKREKITS